MSKISIVVQADYNDVEDRQAMTEDHLAQSLRIIAKQVDHDFKNHRSEQEKYGIFWQHYTVDSGSKPKRNRADTAAQQILNLVDGEK
jgi:hypothetical protein